MRTLLIVPPLDKGDYGMKGHYLEDLKVGMTSRFERHIGEKDITLFSQISGDTNPVHLDENYASKTIFKGRIAHGMLTASFISAALGTQFPGPGSIYISQTLHFKAPVRIGDLVVVEIALTHINAERARVELSTICKVEGKSVLEGEAILMVPRKPKTIS